MKPEDWEKVKSLVEQALTLPEPERLPWLHTQHANSAVIEEAARLLEHTESGIFDSETPEESFADSQAPPVFAEGVLLADRFKIVRFIGRGGMGEVYEALDLMFGAPAALKTLRRDFVSDPRYVARLKREVQIARRLQHPNLCRVHELYRTETANGPVLFLTMELLDGETLTRHMSGSPLPFDEALSLARQIGDGLEAAHNAGILHRDLKPENILITHGKDGQTKAVITDFGLAREADRMNMQSSLFGANAIIGTPPYMAPQQLEGETSDISSDIYSFGTVVYEMLAGRLPFQGQTALAIALQKTKFDAPSLRQWRPDVPLHWESAILACLSKDRTKRPASPREFVACLETNPAWTRAVFARYGRRAAIGALVTSGIGLFALRPWQYLGPANPRTIEIPPNAVASFKRGMEFVKRRNQESILNAIQEFRQAVQIQPQYAEAWAGLAEAYAVASHYDFMEPKLARVEASAASQKALAINERLAKAAASLAYVHSVDLAKWRTPEPLFLRALELDPKEPLTYAWYSVWLGRMGRFDEAIATAKRAVSLDPASFYFNHQLAVEYFRGRRFAEYYQQSRDLVRLHPFEASAYLALARAYEWLGQYEEALRNCDEATKFRNSPASLCFRGTIEATRGNHEEAERIAAKVEEEWKKHPLEANVVANLFARMGRYKEVLSILEQAYAREDSTLLACPTSAYLDGMRSMPEYQRFLAKIGFIPPERAPKIKGA